MRYRQDSRPTTTVLLETSRSPVRELSGGWFRGAMEGTDWQAQSTAVWEGNDCQYCGVTFYLGPRSEVSYKGAHHSCLKLLVKAPYKGHHVGD